MFPNSIIVIVAVILSSGGSTQGAAPFNVKPSHSSDQQPQQPIDQTININNWGLGNDDRKMLLDMKYKIDFLHKKSTYRVCSEDGWVSYANYSYLIIDIPTLNWTDARRTCQMLGGDLAVIRSAAENTFIFQLVIKQKTVQDWGIWLGFIRKAGTKFYWIDDTPLAKGYMTWGSGEPNNVNEKCGNMFGTGSRAGKWNDLTCDLRATHLKSAPVILCKRNAN